MRVYNHGTTFTVSMNEGEIASFRVRWPGSGLQGLHRVSFKFQHDQKQILDVRCNGKPSTPTRMDGAALVALSDDAEKAGRAALAKYEEDTGHRLCSESYIELEWESDIHTEA